MNARQRRRHIRAVRLMSHPEVRRWVTLVVARRDRLLHRALRYDSGSRAARRNAALRVKLRSHPDVRAWKLACLGTYGAWIEERSMSMHHRPVTGRTAHRKPHHEERERDPQPMHVFDTLTGRIREKWLPPPHNFPRTPARTIVGNDAEHNLVVEPAVYLDLVDRHPSVPPGAPFPMPVITRNTATVPVDAHLNRLHFWSRALSDFPPPERPRSGGSHDG